MLKISAISVGSATFCLPGSGKTCGSRDPDPKGNISTKTPKTKISIVNLVGDC